MKYLKIVCKNCSPETATGELSRMLTAIHLGQPVFLSEVKWAADEAVQELETRFKSENETVQALLRSKFFDQSKINFIVSNLEAIASSIYWGINGLPVSAKIDMAFWGDLLQRTDTIWQRIKELSKAVNAREMREFTEDVNRMVMDAKKLSEQAFQVVTKAELSFRELNGLWRQLDGMQKNLEMFQDYCSNKMSVAREGQFWANLITRVGVASNELSRMKDAVAEKKKAAERTATKDSIMAVLEDQKEKKTAVDMLEKDCTQLCAQANILLRNINAADTDALSEVCKAMGVALDQIHTLRASCDKAHINSRGTAALFWSSMLHRLSMAWENTVHCRGLIMKELDARSETNKHVQTETSQFATQMTDLYNKNNRLSDLTNKSMKEENVPASTKRRLLEEVNSFYKECVAVGNKMNGYLRSCPDAAKGAVREMLKYIAGIRQNCVAMSDGLCNALADQSGQEQLLGAIFDGTEQTTSEPQFNADADIQEMLGCKDKGELLKKLKDLQAKLEG